MDAVTDELNRVTKYQYDSTGNVTGVTSLHGTSGAVTTAYAYDATFSIGYDTQSRLQSTTNALSHQTTFQTDTAGRVTAVTSPLSKTTSFSYDLGDLTSTQTPLGHVAGQFLDAAGRPIRVTDATGASTRFEYNAHDEVTKIVDP